MRKPSASMQSILERLAREDAGLPHPTDVAAPHGRMLALLNNLRWNENLPKMAEARTVLHAGMPSRLVVPENDAGSDAILHVHGGGWAFCSPATHEGAARRLAVACRAPVLTIDYRLAPEHPYPCGLEDCLAAWEACEPDRRWSIAGDSAGANLCLALMLRLLADGRDMPAAALLFYGVYGADFETESYVEQAEGPGLTRAGMRAYWNLYALPEQRADPLVAPLCASDPDLARLPPLYLNSAELDPLRSDTELLVARLRAIGRSDRHDLCRGVIHGFMQMGNALPEAQIAFERVGETFREMTP
ncbi:alpha/beta hydrolase [Aliiruegeria sabulilitoris]|uniref:alpha/beta hydrolase n=1 Tax=Aliiruegeria sabulilitoris TaxID=1510458 RepID=UPI000830F6BA|nr:alpha/beta hydrolase [Aliiruegeria sabulilitoris]NDR58813.1 alpha/beta hydrolase [Pseudoruegeria sp. M32A2M]